ncbi:MAG: NAD(+)/NADH kinase [Deltaproteobacteria bacterium]|nr:NAD(+)/NADH kinase [Deltaproteobacteria bacterium]
MNDLKVLVVYRRTTYEEMLDGSGRNHMQTLKSQNDPIFDRILLAHESHLSSMKSIKKVLIEMGIDAVWRYDLSGIIPDNFDLVITIGGDGTVLHASHSIDNTPVLSVNSSPDTSTGYFSACNESNFKELFEIYLSGGLPVRKLYRMEVRINGELVNSRVLNDVLFTNICPASTTRYMLSCSHNNEDQLSSGVWISTAAGSTAAVKGAGGRPMDLESKDLQYIVREPCLGGGSSNPKLPKMVNGIFSNENNLFLRSRSDDISLFIDGPHVVIPVKFGDIVTFSSGKSPIYVVGNFT